MMKKFFLPVVAIAVFASSCQKEDAVSKSNLSLELQAGSANSKKTLPTEEFYETTEGQTPINIVEGKTIQYSSIDPIFHYTAFDGKAVSAETIYDKNNPENPLHNGTDYHEYNFKINVNGNKLYPDVDHAGSPTINNENVYITINGEKYFLIQYHFHWTSEHALNGKKFDMEVHLVHRALDGHVAVVGVFIDKGHDKTKTLDDVFSYLPETEESGVTNPKEFNGFNPASFLPENKDEYFTYSGSLTTPSIFSPAASEEYLTGLRWFVFKKPITVSEEAYNKYIEVYERSNARPLQDIGNRIVLAHNGGK